MHFISQHQLKPQRHRNTWCLFLPACADKLKWKLLNIQWKVLKCAIIFKGVIRKFITCTCHQNVTWFNLRLVYSAAWERSTETPLNRDPELDGEIPLSLQHVATSHKWARQSQPNSHQEIHGNGLQGLAIQRQVADYDRSTMRRCFIIQHRRGYRNAGVTKKRESQQWPSLFFLPPTQSMMWKAIIITPGSRTSSTEGAYSV